MARPKHLRPHPPLSRLGAVALLALLIVPFLEFGLWEAWHDAPTYDEGIYLSSGIDTITSHKWRLTLEHPPLSRVLSDLPVLLAHPVVPHSAAQLGGDEYAWSRVFLAAQVRAGKLRMETFLSRLLPLLVTIGTGLVVYAAASSLTDRWGGVVGAGLWFTLPATLGLGHLMTVDGFLCLTLALTAWALVRVWRRPTPLAVACVGGAAGLDLLVRSTTMPVVGVAALLTGVAFGLRRPLDALRAAAAVGAAALGIVWVGVRLIAPGPVHLMPAGSYTVPFGQAAPVPGVFAAAASVPFPAAYSTGIRLLGRLSPSAPGYLFGHRWIGRWWAYWPLTILAKVPLPALVVIVIGVVGWAGVALESRRRAALILGPLVVAAALPAAATTRQLGVRLVLPVLMLAAIAAAPAARLIRAPIGRLVLGVLAGLAVLALATAGGGALAWTSPPLHPGYRYMADSNLDWGQDWYRLKDWATAHDAWVAYFGAPGLGDILPAKNLLTVNPDNVEGWVAVSASYLSDYRAATFSWLRAYCPVDRIGSTVLVYRFHGPPSTVPGPSTPAKPCWGAAASRRV